MVVRLKDLGTEKKKSRVVRLRDLTEEPQETPLTTSDLRREQTSMMRLQPERISASNLPGVAPAPSPKKSDILLDIAKSVTEQGRQNLLKLARGREKQLGSPLAPREALKIPDKDASLAEQVKFISTIMLRSATDPIGEVGAQVYMPGAGFGTVAKAYQGAGNLISKVAPKLVNSRAGRVAEEVIKDVAVSAPVEFGYATKTAEDNKELLKQTAIGTALGAGLGGAIRGGGEILDILKSAKKSPKALVDREILALPEPRQRGNINQVQTPDVINVQETAPRGLPAPDIQPTIARRGVKEQNVYAQKLQRLFDEANALDQQGRLTPGRELEEVESLWSRMAEPTDPGLDELINLANPKQRTITPSALEKGRMGAAAGTGPNVKSTQYNPFIGQADSPIEKVGFNNTAQQEVAATVKREPVRLADLRAESPSLDRVMEVPRQVSRIQPSQVERGFSETLKASEKTPQGFKERLKAAYTPITNEGTLAQANKRINKDAEEATSYVLGNSRYTAEKATVAQRLIDHYNTQGNFQRAVDIAEKVSEEATRAGQAIQALSMFNRLSPEGVLVYAQRMARKTNEKIPLGMKEVKVTSDMAAELTGLAQATKKMTGVQDLSNNVIDILDRAKTGEKLSDADATTLKRFVQESQQFVKETTRKPNLRPPQQPKDKRVRDNVVSFLDAQEQAAKERLRAKGIQISSTPLDVWADYAIIGASKMGRGAVKFADWSEAMVKDLGENIRPHLQSLYDRSRETYEQSTKKVSQQTISQAERLTEKVIKGKQLEGAEADSFRQLAQKVSGLSGESKRLASQDLQMVLQALDNPTLLRKISSTQTIGQLLNPKTQVRNALGNELFYRVERLNKLIATPIDIARSKITGGERTVTFRTNNQGRYWSNWMRGLKAGWKGVNVQGLETQYDLGSPAFRGKFNPLTYFEKALGASLKSFDTAAYMRAYNNTLGEMATLKAINQGKRGDKAFIENAIRNADDNVQRIADEYGRYVTFQDNNLISQGLVKLKRGLNLGKDFGMGDLILKYPRTPGALLMRAIEYSPAGFVRSGMILFRPWIKKEPNTAEVMQSLSRAIIGTMGLSGMGYFLMDKGILTGAASKDRDIRELQQAAGQGRYQVNLSALKRFIKSNFNPDEAKLKEDDFLYSYDWMQPISMAVSIGANTNKNLREGESSLTGLAGTAYNSLEGGLGTLTEQSVLQGLKRAAEGYPGQTVTDKIFDILSDIPSSFVPTASNQIRQLTDNARRETYDPSKLQSSLNRAQNRIPGLAGKLPQQSDTLGRPKEVYQDNNIFNVMFNPGFASRYKLSPEAKLIVGLIEETGDESLAPRAPSKSITIDGVSVKLSGEEYARMQQYQGEETRKRLERVRTNASLKGKINRVEDALSEGGDKARDRLRREMR